MQAHPARARRPRGPRAVAAQTGKLLPRLPAVGRAEQGRVFDPGVNRVRIGQRRFEMPDALELPRVRRAVVPLVCGEGFAGFRRRVVNKLVALALGHAVRGGGRFAGGCSGLVPGLAAVIRALNDLPKPAARLRRIHPIRINGRSLEMINLPARKVGAAHVPPFALCVRRENERALACANQYSYSAHNLLLPEFCCCRVVLHEILFHPSRMLLSWAGPQSLSPAGPRRCRCAPQVPDQRCRSRR